MHELTQLLAVTVLMSWLENAVAFLKVLVGFSIIIFVHELGHFLAAKWCNVRVDRFAVGFGYRLFGYRRGEGFTLGNRPNYSADDLRQRGYGETDYCFKAFPLGGYVKMLGQDDIVIDDKTGEVQMSKDPRAFTNRTVGQRMIVVSAGVIFNLVFAALAMIGVFFVGLKQVSPIVGEISAGSSSRGKLLPGDVVKAVNGTPVYSYDDMMIEAVFADGPVVLDVERNNQPLGERILVELEENRNVPFKLLPIAPMMTSTLRTAVSAAPGERDLQPADRVIAVEGQEVTSSAGVLQAFASGDGRPIRLQVERKAESGTETFETRVQPVLLVAPDLRSDPLERLQTANILGFHRRTAISQVVSGSPAEKAGLRPGDVIASFGALPNPTVREVFEGISTNADRAVELRVVRGDETHTFKLTPKREFSFFKQERPRIGADITSRFEEGQPVVAAVEPNSPAAALNMPRGSVILAVDGKPVRNWFDVVERLKASAGRTIEVRYRSGSAEAAGTMSVPSSIVNELELPATAQVWAVNGETSARVELQGKPLTLQLPDPDALRSLLEKYVGRRVEIRYSDARNSDPKTAVFEVTEENTDPWQMRIAYSFPAGSFEPTMTRLHAGGNPITAVQMGMHFTYRKLREVYLALQFTVSRPDTGVQGMAGPVGIFGTAIDKAKTGAAELLAFLAILSVNLAVLNFLPLPVLDGGLMVFLLIEKLKGRPLSIKTQMISTLVGLAVIVVCVLVVTLQDIGRLLS